MRTATFTIITLLLLSTPCFSLEEPSDSSKQLRLLVEWRKAEAEILRNELLQWAMIYRERDKAEAVKELSIIDQQKQEIEFRNKAREFALGDYYAQERQNAETDLSLVSARMGRLQRSRDRWTKIFLTIPEDSKKGSIWSGTAFNHLYMQVAGTAFENANRKADLAADIKSLEVLIENEKDDEKLAEYKAKKRTAESKLELLRLIEQAPAITADDRKHLRFRLGLSAGGPTIEVGKGICPINWNAFASLPDGKETFAYLESKIEGAKKKAVAELEKDGGVSRATLDQLFSGADELKWEVKRYRERLFHGDLKSFNSGTVQRILYGTVVPAQERFRYQVLHFMTARSMNDLGAKKEFTGETINELLAYMRQNDLYLIEADYSGQATYEKLMRELVQYVLDLKGLQYAIAYDKQTLGRLQQREDTLFEVKYESYFDGIAKASQKSPLENLIEGLAKVNELID